MGIVISDLRAAILEAQEYENNPFVAWENLATGETLGGTSVLTGGAATNATNGNTVSFWLPDVSGTTADFEVTFASATSISFAAIVAHNLSDFGGSVSVQRSTDSGSNWSDAGAGAVTPTDNAPIAWRMLASDNDAADWRFRFTGLTAGDALAVGVAFMGRETVIPRRFYQGFAPVLSPTEVELQSNVSVGGNLISSSVVKRGSRLSAEIGHIDPTFLRGDDWPSFQQSFNDGAPAFFAWRPEKYPGDLHYIWRDGDVIRPVNSGPRDLMSVSIGARVYEG